MYSLQSQHQNSSSGVGSRGYMETSRSSLLSGEKLNSMVRSTEELLDRVATPTKSYLPKVGRFLLVSCFIEDAFRIILQWSTQMDYICHYRGFPKVLAFILLSYFCIGMLVSALFVVFRFKTMAAGLALLSIIVLQAFAYGLMTDMEFLMRNISIVGGLLILLAEEHSAQDKESRQGRGMFAGLPSALRDYAKDRATWLSLFGRICIVALVLTMIFAGEMSIFRLFFGGLSLLVSVMVVVGFKAKFGAVCLLLGLSIFNVIINNWWSLHRSSHMRDFLKFDFFQTLSVIGGLILLVVTGPGSFSIDEKHKEF